MTESRGPYPNLVRERTRHGREILSYREGKGPRVRLRSEFGSAAFEREYKAAVAAYATAARKRLVAAPDGSLAWLIQEFRKSRQWRSKAAETHKQLGRQFALLERGKAAREPFRAITTRTVEQGVDNRAAVPSDARKFLRAVRMLFAWAVDRGLVSANPAAGVRPPAYPNAAHGFAPWTAQDVARFEARWPVGTRERLAFDLLRFTGLRRGDAVRVGRQHVRNGVLTLRTAKTGTEVSLPILEPLARSLAATPGGDLSFLATAKGRGFTKESFGNFFRGACRAAGVAKSCHGVRKLAATTAAERGATEAQLNAVFGWASGSREAATYTRGASRKRLAATAARLLLDDDSPHLLDVAEGAGTEDEKTQGEQGDERTIEALGGR